MKKNFFALLLAIALFSTAQAQTERNNDVGMADKKVMTKAEKQAAKDKKEADLAAAFAKSGVTKSEEAQVRKIMDESNEMTKPIKANESMSDADKKEKLDAIYHDRNEKMKDAMGKEKYKAFKDAQKAQKEAMSQQ